MSELTYIIKASDCGAAIKDIMRREFDFSSRLRNRLKREKLIFLNGESVPGWITPRENDVLTIRMPEETSQFEPEPIPIDAVFEDENMLIINKQPGFVVHPTKGHPNHTIANGVMQYMLDTKQSYKIRFINRLDMDTSGILAVAKNSLSQASFMKQGQAGLIEKRYVSIVKGVMENDEGVIDLPIGRPDPDRVERGVMADGRPSITHYKVLERFSRGYTLTELLLETGRTHQIRVHMAAIGHPVAGDHLYGEVNPFLIERQALHAQKLSFLHPVTGERLFFEAAMPSDMQNLLDMLRNG